jgi:hypothetical protein
VAYSLIRPKTQIPSIRHDGTLSIGNFMLMMKKPKNLEFEPVHPKNVLLSSVVHGISCLLFVACIEIRDVSLKKCFYQLEDGAWSPRWQPKIKEHNFYMLSSYIYFFI